MRILFHTFLYIVDTNQFHHFHGTLLSIFFADVLVMCAERLYQLAGAFSLCAPVDEGLIPADSMLQEFLGE